MEPIPDSPAEEQARQNTRDLEELRPFADVRGEEDIERAHGERRQMGDPEVPLEDKPGERPGPQLERG